MVGRDRGAALSAATGRDRPIVVTGASGGIGHAVVVALLQRGFDVRAVTRSADDAQRLRSELDVPTVNMDLTSGAAVQQATRDLAGAGSLYGLVNVAGVALPGPLEQVPPEQLQRQLDVNVIGQLRVTQALLPALRAGAEQWGEARIVMMGSLDARIVGPLLGPYAASKLALVGLSDALRAELAPSRVRVLLLEPGAVATPIWRRGTAVLGRLQETRADRGGPHRRLMSFSRRHVSRLSEWGAPPHQVGEVVARMMVQRFPAPRRVVGLDATITAAALAVLPSRVIYGLAALPARWSARQPH